MKNFYLNNKRIVTAFIYVLIPLLICFVYTVFKGIRISDIWLPASEWNDELFYFKQVECMVKDRVPLGYFGYNESRAEFMSFGAWSPAILIPWALMGKLFGWTYASPYIFNFTFITIAFFIYGMLAGTELRKTLSTALFMLLTAPLCRYIFSCMPEILCVSLIIPFVGIFIGYDNSKHKKGRIVASWILAGLLTIIRPYFVLFFIFPYMKKSIGGKIKTFSLIIAALSILTYFVIEKYATAPYFGDVYSLAWLDYFKNYGVIGGLPHFAKTIGHYFVSLASATYGGLRNGYAIGIYFGVFLILLALMIFEAARLKRKKDRRAELSGCLALCMTGILLAIILMYSLTDGFRHLLVFIVAGLLLAGNLSEKAPIRDCFLIIVLLWLFVIKGTNPMYFRIPLEGDNNISKSELDEMKSLLETEMEMNREPSWENTVLLLFSDMRDESSTVITPWQYAYGLPSGYAVSLCNREYVKENINGLKSKYALVLKDGETESLLIGNGMEYIWSNEEVSLLKLR